MDVKITSLLRTMNLKIASPRDQVSYNTSASSSEIQISINDYDVYERRNRLVLSVSFLPMFRACEICTYMARDLVTQKL